MKQSSAGSTRKPAVAQPKQLIQVAALPFRLEVGILEILLITSRETGRWVIPKGWPMKGLSDRDAAAREAEEEAGVVGKIRKKPIGSYTYWKRRTDRFDLVQVEVFPLKVERHLANWRERGQRRLAWFSPEHAAGLVDEPGLGDLIRRLPGEIA